MHTLIYIVLACPEILRGETYLGPGVDIWSMGIVLYCLVVGRQPWDGANAEELIHGILEEGLEVPEGITDGNFTIFLRYCIDLHLTFLRLDCVNLVLSMLRVNEEDRISIAEMRYHPWVCSPLHLFPPSLLLLFSAYLFASSLLTSLSPSTSSSCCV